MEEATEIDWGEASGPTSRKHKKTRPIIRLNRNGTFTLSGCFKEKAQPEIAGHKYVGLHYFRKLNCIAFQFSKKKLTGYVTLVDVNNGSNVSAAARGVLKDWGVDAETYFGDYEAGLFEIPKLGKCWVIYLNFPADGFDLEGRRREYHFRFGPKGIWEKRLNI